LNCHDLLRKDYLEHVIQNFIVTHEADHQRHFTRLRFENSDIYFGEVDSCNSMNGTGVLISPDKSFSRGNFRHNILEGVGFRKYSNGDTYSGTFIDGKRGGFGEFTSKTGEKYVGNWSDDEQSGQGECTFADGNRNGSVYQGEWKHGLRSGFGVNRRKNGDVYTGEWYEDKRHGSGEQKSVQTSYNSYNGEWVKDLYCGHGTLTYKDGTIFIGQWKDSKAHGPGIMHCTIKHQIYYGSWKNGRRCGAFEIINNETGQTTTLTYDDNGEIHGNMVICSPEDCSIENSEYNHGEIVSENCKYSDGREFQRVVAGGEAYYSCRELLYFGCKVFF
jgi:hypothetical protein